MERLKNKIIFDVLRPVSVAVVLGAISSCGGGSGSADNSDIAHSENVNPSAEMNDSENTQAGALVDGSWKLGDFIFVTDSDTEGQAIQNSNLGNKTRIVVGDSLFDSSNGNYSGSVLRIVLSTNGSGDYVVTDEVGAESTFDSGANVAWLYVIAGATSQQATQWDSTETSGNLTVTVNEEGRYFVSTKEPIIVSKSGQAGTGVVGAPDQISLEFLNISGKPI